MAGREGEITIIRRYRLMEWLCAAIILASGIHLLAFPMTFHRPALEGLGHVASYQFWTTALLVTGAGRIAALWINGHWLEGTPGIRLAGAVAGMAIFGTYAGAYIAVSYGPAPSPAIDVYLLLMVADLVSVAFATADIIHAGRARE